MNARKDHGYEAGTVEGMAENVAAANPGEHVVRVDDEYGTDVVPMRKLPLSDDERDAILAGDLTVLADGSRVQLLRRAVQGSARDDAERDTKATGQRGACAERDTVRRHTKVQP